MELNVIVYTMKGCPFCDQFKDMLRENKIEFYDRDIHEYNEEYQLYTEISKCDLIPSLMIIETDGENNKTYIYAPEQHYNQLTEALDIIKEHKLKFGII